MSDAEQTHLLRVADGESPTPQTSAAERAGALLRASREAAGFSLDALAAVVKVPVRKLEALEAGRLDALPEPVFVRGMVVGICRVLQADAQAILALLPAAPTKPLKQEGAIAPMPFEMTGADSPHRLLEVVARPYIRWTLALVLGAGLLYFWPALSSGSMRSAVESEALSALQPWVAKGTVASAPEQNAVSAPLPVEAEPVVVPVPPIAAPIAAPSAAASAAASNPASDAPPPLPVPLGDVIRFKSHGKTWLEIADGKGAVVMRRVLADGEQTGVGGHLPLSVVIGNADATEVWVRGKVFDIKSIAQGNVARFEVK